MQLTYFKIAIALADIKKQKIAVYHHYSRVYNMCIHFFIAPRKIRI